MKTLELNYRSQEFIYNQLNYLAISSRLGDIVGRLGAIPVAVLETGLDLLKCPVAVIEGIAYTALNLVGAAFFKKCSLENAGHGFKETLRAVALFPIFVLFSPFEVIGQTIRIAWDPTTARPLLEVVEIESAPEEELT